MKLALIIGALALSSLASAQSGSVSLTAETSGSSIAAGIYVAPATQVTARAGLRNTFLVGASQELLKLWAGSRQVFLGADIQAGAAGPAGDRFRVIAGPYASIPLRGASDPYRLGGGFHVGNGGSIYLSLVRSWSRR